MSGRETEADIDTAATTAPRKPARKKRHLLRDVFFASLFSLAVILIVGRIYLPYWVKDYVNATINNIDGYSGSVDRIGIALYRGAYVIHDLKIFKEESGIPVPFINIARTDLSLQWGALFRGRIVGDVTLDRPVINFATGQSGATQDGTDTDWTVPIKELMPLDINWVEINDGHIAYRNFASSPNVDIYIEDLFAHATNLRNIEDSSTALPSTLTARGTSLGGGALAIDGRLNILKQIPDFDIDAKLESVNLTAMNSYARPFAGIDFEGGELNVYSELIVDDGAIGGYVKPLATDVRIIDSEPESALKFIWEGLVSAVVEIFSNQRADQFATQIELQGRLDSPETNIWKTLGGILRNAFGEAFTRSITPE